MNGHSKNRKAAGPAAAPKPLNLKGVDAADPAGAEPFWGRRHTDPRREPEDAPDFAPGTNILALPTSQCDESKPKNEGPRARDPRADSVTDTKAKHLSHGSSNGFTPVLPRQCKATTKAGKPCPGHRMHNSELCMAHTPGVPSRVGFRAKFGGLEKFAAPTTAAEAAALSSEILVAQGNGKMDPRTAAGMIQTLSFWLAAHRTQVLEKQLEELRLQMAKAGIKL